MVLYLKSIIYGRSEGWVAVYVCLYACAVGVNAHVSACESVYCS